MCVVIAQYSTVVFATNRVVDVSHVVAGHSGFSLFNIPKGGVPPPIEVINADLDGTAQGYRSAVHDGPARWVERWAGLGCQLLFEFE